MAIGRLRPEVSPAEAAATLHATNRRLFPLWKSSYQDERATWNLQPLHARVVGEVGPLLFVVLAAVGVVLLIACANAVTLLIARSLTRARELAIRAALGASRARLLRQLFFESAVLAGGAAAVGVAVAAVTLSLVATYGAEYIPRVDEVRLSGAAAGWLAGLAAASGLLIFVGSLGGLPSTVGRSALGLESALKSSGRGSTEGGGTRRLRRLLVAGEFALATPLVVASVLVLASLARLSAVDVGIDTTRVLTAQVSLPAARYDEPARAAFWKRAIDRLARAPGVQAVAIADSRPPADAGNLNNFDLEDRPTPPGENQPIATWVAASPGFFAAVGLAIDQGRGLDDRSFDDNEVVVDRAWARRFFPGEAVVGRRLREGGCTTCPWTTVIGLVETVKWQGLDAADSGTVYYPFVDFPSGYIVARTDGDPISLAAGVRDAVRDLDPGLAVADVASGPELIASSIAQPRSLAVVFGIFAATAVALSVVGIYGIMAYFVEQRRREIGIRIALGGHPAAVRRMILGQGVRLVAAGVAVGIGAAFVSARWLTSVLFEISATDGRILIAAGMMLVAAAALASLGPARRAAAIDPATLLRDG
jgi:predicted permease